MKNKPVEVFATETATKPRSVKSAYIIAYMLCGCSGYVMGVLTGFVLWHFPPLL